MGGREEDFKNAKWRNVFFFIWTFSQASRSNYFGWSAIKGGGSTGLTHWHIKRNRPWRRIWALRLWLLIIIIWNSSLPHFKNCSTSRFPGNSYKRLINHCTHKFWRKNDTYIHVKCSTIGVQKIWNRKIKESPEKYRNLTIFFSDHSPNSRPHARLPLTSAQMLRPRRHSVRRAVSIRAGNEAFPFKDHVATT